MNLGKARSYQNLCVLVLLCVAIAVASPAQTYTTLVSFDGTNGSTPVSARLVQGTDGNFYGTTAHGGPNTQYCAFNCGTVFKVTPTGVLTTLHKF